MYHLEYKVEPLAGDALVKRTRADLSPGLSKFLLSQVVAGILGLSGPVPEVPT